MNTGIYINLDRSSARRKLLRASLAKSGLKANRYCRFSAIEPLGDEPELSRGLRTKGELGIWKSLIAALEHVAVSPFSPIVHFLEDDASPSSGIARQISFLSELLTRDPRFSALDIVFLDYFLSRELFALVLDARSRNLLSGAPFSCVSASKYYLACISSFLIRRSSAFPLASALRHVLASSNPLPPVDLAIRSLLRNGRLNGWLLLPPQGAPCWEQDAQSLIQTGLDDRVRRSQRAHVLLRILASGQQSPLWCADQLGSLYSQTHSLSTRSGPQDFLDFFNSCWDEMVAY